MKWYEMIGAPGSLWAQLLDARETGAPWWQILVIIAVVAVAALAAQVWLGRARRIRGGAGAGGAVDTLTTVPRPHFAVIAFVLLAAARPIVELWEPAGIVRLALIFAGALAVIRVIVHLIWRAFPTATSTAIARWLGLLVWIGVVLLITGYLDLLVTELDETVMRIGKQTLSLWDILRGAFWIGLTLLGALWASAILEGKLLGAEALHVNVRVVLARLTRAALLLVAILLGLSLVGLDVTALSVFGGALGIGLGLGLQRIASNYVSGFIILLERSLRPGDMVQVREHYGRVTEIRTRFTVIRALNGVEFVVPNEMLASEMVQNFSASGSAKVGVQVQVAYGSDPELVLRLLREAAAAQPRVLADPGPAAFLAGFGADGLNFDLAMRVADPENGLMSVQSAVNLAVLRAFTEHGIQIPYPQREVRMLGQAPSA